jgi:toxin CcdB
MRQFDICENRHTATSKRAPYIVVLQSDLLDLLEVRLVAPLVRATGQRPIEKLMLPVEIANQLYLLSMIELASVRTQLIGKTIGTMDDRRDEIIAAIDLLITGV